MISPSLTIAAAGALALGPATRAAAEPGRDHRDPHVLAERVVDHGAEDHVGVGVGMARDPRIFLQDGDTVTISIEKIGELTNPVLNEPGPA